MKLSRAKMFMTNCIITKLLNLITLYTEITHMEQVLLFIKGQKIYISVHKRQEEVVSWVVDHVKNAAHDH